ATFCMVHCLVFPLMTIIPVGFSNNHWVDLFFTFIGMLAVVKITKKIGLNPITILLWFSISVVTLSILAEMFFHKHYLTLYLGFTGLIFGHIFIHFKYKH
nr:MerC family mercury resistance protein [Flavobacteriales bacterium]